MNPYLLDDSDSQWAELERQRTYISRVSRPYWQAIEVEERERILRAIPDGHRLVITPGYRSKPGTADVSLRTADNRHIIGENRGYLTAQLCWSLLPRTVMGYSGLVVTADKDGWVTDIEEVD